MEYSQRLIPTVAGLKGRAISYLGLMPLQANSLQPARLK